MRGAVMGGHVAVLGLDQHLAIGIDQNGAEGMVAVGHGAARDLERPPQEMRVAFRGLNLEISASSLQLPKWIPSDKT